MDSPSHGDPQPPGPRPPSRPTTALTPEVRRRIEESRLRAKAIRQQREAGREPAAAEPAPAGAVEPADRTRTNVAKKRPAPPVDPGPSSNRDGRQNQPSAAAAAAAGPLRPAKRFAKYVDWNLSAMSDSKGGFLSAEDDPSGEAARLARLAAAAGAEQKPKNMTDSEWDRLRLLRTLRKNKAGPYEPGVSVLAGGAAEKHKCRECESPEIDWVWDEVFAVAVCQKCKDRLPEKYSLLTKTECREDYLLTEPELRDVELLPHLSRPNPHKAHWHDMMLFLRCQVEEYALGPKKWGSAEALDAEFQRRQEDKKRRKEAKFKEKLVELKRKTRTDTFRRQVAAAKASGGRAVDEAKFGDVIGGPGRHVHQWGRTVENEDGVTVKTCVDCGMEVEELEF